MKKLLFLLLLTFNVSADSVLIQWIPPTEYEDNTQLNNDLVGFNIYYGNSSGVYSSNINIPDPLVTSYTMPLSAGTYYYVITAYALNGAEGVYSTPEVSVTIEPERPKQVTVLPPVILP